MRVLFAKPSRGAHDFIVDSRGRARLAKTGGIASPKLAGLAAACALLAIAPATLPGERLIASGRAAVQSAADLIRARSPGLRSRADLVKTKHPYVRPHRAAHAAPRHRRPAPPRPAVALLAPPPPAVPLAFDSAELAPAYQPLFAGPVPVFAERSPVPCCFETFNPPLTTSTGLIIGPGGGGPVPPPPSVPEPQSWVLMILGFGVLGTLWRRRRALLQAALSLPRLFHARMLLLAHARAA